MQICTYINSQGQSITFSKSAPFVLRRIDPNSVGANAITSRAMSVDGHRTHDVTYNARTIILEIAITGQLNGRYNYQEYTKNWQRLSQIFDCKETGTLVYQNDGGVYQISCRLFELPNPIKHVGSTNICSLELIADDPYWLSRTEFKHRLGHVVGGKKYPLRYPLQFGTWVKNAMIVNDQSRAIPLTVEIQSTALFITLTNETTGEYLKVDLPLDENQKMIIWTGNDPYVLVQTFAGGELASEEYANYKLDVDSKYFKLVPGVNNITIDNGYPDITASAIIIYRKRYIGV